ncbi:MAG: hypothetical protein HY725_15085 [Candidatus Rokubacteria bacterium]|nr:hypothetical protein [Candidatus Rokubacteria bacterium]
MSREFDREFEPWDYAGYDDRDDSKLHEDCVPRDEAFSHVMENEFDEVREAVAEADAQGWLDESAETIELINIVSSYDREQLRAAIRDVLNVDARAGREVSPEFFAVAADVAKFLERTRSPYTETYGITESVEWVGDLLEIARLIREILFALSEQHQMASTAAKVGATPAEPPKPSKLDRLTRALSQRDTEDMISRAFRRPHDRLNDILQHGVVYRLRQEGRRPPRIVREVDAEKTPLRVVLAYWMSGYLSLHSRHVDLAVCAECGKIFARERRDNVYCSKTCQNRVAYKRKKIVVAEVLREVNVKDSPNELRAGLCLNHPRFGLGVIEDVRYLRRRLRLRYDDSSVIDASAPIPMKLTGTSFPIPDGKSAQEFFEEVKARDARTIAGWQEVVDPGSLVLSVRFLSGVRRFSRWEIESGTKEMTFYAVENPRLLAEML